MKKIYVYALLCIPLCLILGLGSALSIGAGGQTAQRGPQYSRETDVTSMVEVGKLLEQLGKQMQQKSISIGGNSYVVNDKGSLEISVSQMGMQLEIGFGQRNPNQRSTTLVAYALGARTGTPGVLSELIGVMAKSMAGKGTFDIEDHSVALKGTASVKIRLMKNVQQRRNRPPYAFVLDVVFGDKDFPQTDDDVDFAQEVEHGDVIEVAKRRSKILIRLS